MTTRGGVTTLLLGLALSVACGREDVELAAPLSSPGPDGGPDPTLRDGGAPIVTSCDAAVARACRALDRVCLLDAECCSGRCEGGVCLPSGACRAAGAACGGASECCSARCEPSPGTTNRACAPLCKAAGAACTAAQECCSTGCRGGVCTDAACAQVGDACASPSECCSGVCDDGRCRLDAVALCRPTGEDCSSGGGQGCCGTCEGGRCGPGPGACRARTAPCERDADCCAGTCTGPGDAKACGGTCAEVGVPCRASSDCCSGACSGSPGVCLAADASACGVLGETCSSGAACCSGVCLDGRCADNCGALR